MKHERRFQRQFDKREEPQSGLRLLLDYFRPRRKTTYRSDAYNTLLLLRGEPILAAKELIYAHCQLIVEKGSRLKTENSDRFFKREMTSEDLALDNTYDSMLLSWAKRFQRLFTQDFIQHELQAAATVMISQQLCGVNVLIFYSTTLFCDASNNNAQSAGDRSALRPLLLSWGLGLCNFIFSYPAYRWIETVGRRRLMLLTLPWLGFLMAMVGVALAKQETRQQSDTTVSYSDSRRDGVAAIAYVFMAIYSVGLGPVPFTLSAEMFPLEERMVGMSVAVSLNFLGAGLLTLLVPTLSNNLAVVLGPFAVLNFFAYVFIWIFVREVAEEDIGNRPDDVPRPVTLEDLFQVFSIPIKVHLEHRWAELRGLRLRLENNVPASLLAWVKRGSSGDRELQHVNTSGARSPTTSDRASSSSGLRMRHQGDSAGGNSASA